jgi:hypothetical protein
MVSRNKHAKFGSVYRSRATSEHAYIHAHAHAHTHTNTHTYILSCIHTYINTYTHTHTHTRTHNFSWIHKMKLLSLYADINYCFVSEHRTCSRSEWGCNIVQAVREYYYNIIWLFVLPSTWSLVSLATWRSQLISSRLSVDSIGFWSGKV